MRTTPALEFAWEPADCDVYTLTVLQGGEVQWHLCTVEDRNGLRSPIRYGVTPSGARASNTTALFPGPYIVELARLDESGLQV